MTRRLAFYERTGVSCHGGRDAPALLVSIIRS